MIDEATRTFITKHASDDVRQLALQAARYPEVDMRVAATQIEGRRLAKNKLPAWAAVEGVIYPVRLSMEQCSSETTAQYKASLVQGTRLADLTGGFGIDCSYMSERFAHTTYVERNEELCRIAEHNFALLDKAVEVRQGQCEEILDTLPEQDWIFLDPARRDRGGNKVVALNDCEPDVCSLEPLLLQKSAHVMVKCSPMLDISQAIGQLRSVTEVHVVAVAGECKELLFVLSRDKDSSEIRLCTVNIQGEHTQTFDYLLGEEAETTCHYANRLGQYLYEPNSALMKAGCYRLPAQRYGLDKLHPNTHLYTSDTLVEGFPGRVFKVEGCHGFSKKELKALDCRQANLTVRNFPEHVDTLRKRLRIGDGGATYLFATTLHDGAKVLIRCVKA
jgi:16S rRNA G966 N2-methylase RsmD